MKLAFFKHVGVSSLAAGWVTSHTGSQIPKLLLQLPNENEVGRGKPGQANPLEISKCGFCSPFLQTTLFFFRYGHGFSDENSNHSLWLQDFWSNFCPEGRGERFPI